MLELMERHLAAYAANDWNAYKADLAPDATYEEVASGKRVQGRDEYLAAVKHWKTAFPDARATIKRSFELDDTAITELEWEGTHTGPLDTPFGTIPATNKKGRLPAVLITTFKDGKVVETRHYFDAMTIFLQVGPTAGATPFKAAQPVVH